MPGETLSFDIVSRDAASRNIREVGRAAADSSPKLAAASAALAAYNREAGKTSDLTARSIPALRTAAAASASHAKATKTLADVEKFFADEATRARQETERGTASTSVFRRAADAASATLSDLGGALQGGASGMGLMVAAGVALAPIVVTVGAGLGGLGLAAAGIIGPVIKAAEASGGLEKNLAKLDPAQRQAARSLLALRGSYQVFQDELKPTVLADFNAALNAARPLLVGLEPVAEASGRALAQVFAQVGATFRSGEWQQFFRFLAANAGPDIRQLGQAMTDLAKALPPLVEELHPLGTALVGITDATAKLVGGGGLLGVAGVQVTALKDAAQGTHDPLMGLAHWMLGLAGGLGSTVKQSGPAAAGIHRTGANAQAAAGHVQSLFQQVTNLNNAESKSLNTQLAYSNALITGRNDALSLAGALKKSHDQIGLHTAAERASFSAANTYIGDLINIANTAHASGRGVGAAITAIRNGLPILDSAKTKSKLYWQEIATLKAWLDKLRNERPISEAIHVHGDGTFSVGTFRVKGAAAGMMVRGGTPGRDSVLIKAMPGEVVVPTSLVSAGAVDHLRGRIPGFAAGGIVPRYSGNVAGLVPWAGHDVAAATSDITRSIGSAMAKAFAGAVAAAKQAAATSGALGGGAAANMALARRMMPAWGSGYEWAAWDYVNTRESGWNRFARNPSSGAYGIPQALPESKLPFAGQAAGGSHAGAQLAWQIGYFRGRYGDPAGAASHERAFGWYDRGGWLPTGLSLAYNGTGRPEQVIPGGRGGGTMTVIVKVDPAVAAATPDRRLGQHIGQHVTEAIRGGMKLYPAGVTPR